MVRPPSSSLIFIRHTFSTSRSNPFFQFRNLTSETENEEFGGNFNDSIKEICLITERRSSWELTLKSEFPSLNFSDPNIFHAYLNYQNDAFLSLRFFKWLCSHCGFTPDQSSCNALFDLLLDAKACKEAKSLLDLDGFVPKFESLECYVRFLSRGGMVEEAVNVFSELKKVGFCPSVAAWNVTLSACLKAGRTDLFWTLYEMMMASDVISNIDVETIGLLIRAYCHDNKVSNAYGLLRQILEDGLCPDNNVFNSLISRFCEEGEYERVSELLHIMIAKGRAPDIYTYQRIINGLFKRREMLEGLRIFHDLKDRGYFPDLIMYTTVIKGLFDMGWHGEARKLWFEMIQKGILPNESAYSLMINRCCRIGDLDHAKELYKEMCDKGYEETTVTCNAMISGLCSSGRTDEAHRLFEEMSEKGIVCDAITYNSLIQGFSKKGELVEAKKLLYELLSQGLEPPTYSINYLIKQLCEVGDTQEAIRLWKDMVRKNWEPTIHTYGYIVTGLCEEGNFAEATEYLLEMRNKKLKPWKSTFKILISCLLENDKLDDVLVVLDLMLTMGYTPHNNIIQSIVRKFDDKNFNFAGTCLERILEKN